MASPHPTESGNAGDGKPCPSGREDRNVEQEGLVCRVAGSVHLCVVDELQVHFQASLRVDLEVEDFDSVAPKRRHHLLQSHGAFVLLVAVVFDVAHRRPAANQVGFVALRSLLSKASSIKLSLLRMPGSRSRRIPGIWSICPCGKSVWRKCSSRSISSLERKRSSRGNKRFTSIKDSGMKPRGKPMLTLAY